ncbi:MAG: SIMPL domain-containing protein [Alphaproteobacteria bacterium]|nr:SIMPL domain-containing protein [Alphaproteobacteria bacterium]
MKTVPTLAAALTLAGAMTIAAAGITNAEEPKSPATPRIISVTGTGEVKAKPDMAILTGGVVTEAETASAALAKNNEVMNALIAGLKEAGIKDEDIQTANFAVSPKYTAYDSSNTAPPRIIGYSVTNEVSITVRDIARLGDLLDRLVKLGANNVNGVSFTLADPKPVLNKAREEAVRDAKAKADLLAATAGVSVTRVLSITEGGGGMPQPMLRMMAADAQASTPIAAGQETMSATVTVMFEIQ